MKNNTLCEDYISQSVYLTVSQSVCLSVCDLVSGSNCQIFLKFGTGFQEILYGNLQSRREFCEKWHCKHMCTHSFWHAIAWKYCVLGQYSPNTNRYWIHSKSLLHNSFCVLSFGEYRSSDSTAGFSQKLTRFLIQLVLHFWIHCQMIESKTCRVCCL